MAPGVLLSKFGTIAVEQLLAEVRKYPEIYSVLIWPKQDVSFLTFEGQTAWQKVVDVMQETFGPEANSDACWQSWRSLRNRHFLGRRNPQHAPQLNKWGNKLDFLNEIPEGSGLGTPCRQFIKEQSSVSSISPGKRQRAIANEFGDNIIRVLLSEVAKYPRFHNCGLVRRTKTPDELDESDRQLWDQIMSAVNQHYPSAPSNRVWTAWQNLRIYHFNNRTPKKWTDEMEFLGAPENQNGENVEVEDTPQTPRLRSIVDYSEAAHRSRSTDSPKMRRIAHEFGDDIVKLLIGEIAKYPIFHKYSIAKIKNPEDLEECAYQTWEAVMSVINDRYPTAASSSVWAAWRNLRTLYQCKKSPKKWADYLTFLRGHENEPPEEEEEMDTTNTPQTRSTGCPIRLNYNEENPHESFVKIDRPESTGYVDVVNSEPSPPNSINNFAHFAQPPPFYMQAANTPLQFSLLQNSTVHAMQPPQQQESFKPLLKMIYSKILRKRNSETTLNLLRHQSLKIINNLHGLNST